ncbi:MAG: NAD-dependent epimerase/dehydratase family protein [Chloroflexi bacterium]|nr:NAD-dependent epimerase/dehydratase family protein [Chloroflexota bacterium]
MRVLVTGSTGFVGQKLVPCLLTRGHTVIAAHLPGDDAGRLAGSGVTTVPMDLRSSPSIREALGTHPDAVVHLAAVASGGAARNDPALAWEINAAGTARILDEITKASSARSALPRFLLASSIEVYGAGEPRPRRETDPLNPSSPYAASKRGAELACLETSSRTGLPVVIARATNHTGAGQTEQYFVPALVNRITRAKAAGEGVVRSGNLEVVRDFLDVDDVVRAYVILLERDDLGGIFNVSSGVGRPLAEVVGLIADLAGADVQVRPDPALERSADIPHLVGDNSRLVGETGWGPKMELEETLRTMIEQGTIEAESPTRE